QSIPWVSIVTGPVYRVPLMWGAVSLLEPGGIPAIQARTTSYGRELRIAFDFARSNWPEQPSFPVFVANVLRWTTPNLGRTVERTCIVGRSCGVDPRLIGVNASLVTVATEGATTSAEGLTATNCSRLSRLN